MSANIVKAFTAGDEGFAWWDPQGECHVAEPPKTIAKARELAGQQWEPIVVPGYERIPVTDPATFAFQADAEGKATDEVITNQDGVPVAVYRQLTGEKRIARSDTTQHLATVLDSWEPIGMGEMWSFVEAMLKEEKGFSLRTGGVLNNSRQVWALARLDEPWQAPGDPSATYPYVVFLNHFDGRNAAKVLNTTIRVVCANTFGAADDEGGRTGRQFVFRHTSGVHDRIEQAKAALKGFRRDTTKHQELMAHLARLGVTSAMTEKFLSEYVPMPPAGISSDRVIANVEETRKQLREILASPTCEGIRDSAYGWVMAAGQHLDHARSARTWETRLRRQLLTPEPAKGKAITIAQRIVKQSPRPVLVGVGASVQGDAASVAAPAAPTGRTTRARTASGKGRAGTAATAAKATDGTPATTTPRKRTTKATGATAAAATAAATPRKARTSRAKAS